MADGGYFETKFRGIGVASDVWPPIWPVVRVSGAGLGNQWGDFFHIAHTHPSGSGELPFWGLGT